MFSNTLSVYLVVYLLLDFTYGKSIQETFQKDYNYIEALQSYFKIHMSPKPWRDAKLMCDQEVSSLFYPENTDEANAVISFWKLHQNSTQPNDTWLYVGMSDIISEGVYETVKGKAISDVYNNWKVDQPDNSGDEDCLHMNQEGRINDIRCDAEYIFICKKSLPSDRNCKINQLEGSKGKDGKSIQETFQKDYNYIEALQSYFKIHMSPKPWRDAKLMCDQEESTLFYPENTDEANAVISFWKLHQNSTQPNDTWLYVGMSDIISEGVYETVKGKAISDVYNNWKVDQPDNSGDEDCLHMNQEGRINDIRCDAEYIFICKKSLPSDRNCKINQLEGSKGKDGKSIQETFQKDYNYIEALQSYFKIHMSPKPWRDAKLVCDQEESSLFYPENTDEANAVISFWKLHQNSTQPNDTWLYVGMSDIISEGVYETVKGKAISDVYNNWKVDQPDNSGDEDCLHMNQEGRINDIRCDAEYIFICKKNLPSDRNCKINQLEGSKGKDGKSIQETFQKDYNYIEALQSYFKIHMSPKPWRDAKLVCNQEEASLFYPENTDEANAVISFWKLHQNSTQPNDTWLYVGMSDIISEGVYETVKGKAISDVYNNWKVDQPDNSGDEDCLHMNQEGRINDIRCDAEYIFICKKSLPSDCNCKINQLEGSKGKDGHKDKKFFRKDYTYIESEESFYKVHSTARTFADAKRMCALEGASLYYAENADEVNAVATFWSGNQPSIPWVFVGLTDEMAEGLFETIDRRPISEVYSRWQRFQPDNSGNNEDCVHMDVKGTMNDYICDTKANFICKKTLQSLQWNYDCSMPYLDYTYNKDTDKCYKLHTTPLNWADAYATCRTEYTSLAVITNRMEADYLAKLTDTTQKPKLTEQYQRGIYHVGFHNRFKNGWQTVKGTPMNVDADAWFDNYQPDGNHNEECGSMFFNGRLINTDCNTKSMFICEHKVDSGSGSNSTTELNEENYY